MAKTYLEIEQEDGSILRFTKEKIKARWLKEVFKLEKKINELGQEENYADVMDVRIGFLVDFFKDPKLTEDAIYDGIDSDKIISECNRITNDIVGRTEEDKKTGKS